MARGRRKVGTPQEQLDRVELEIKELEETLKEKRAIKKDLEREVNLLQVSELNDLLNKEGLTIDDIKDMIAKKK